MLDLAYWFPRNHAHRERSMRMVGFHALPLTRR
jgi:hypothetical protein